MIGFMPEIYPNELVYSWLARYHVRSGHSGYQTTYKELLAKKSNIISKKFINRYSEDFLDYIEQRFSIEELLMNHTLFSIQFKFMPENKRQKIIDNYKIVDSQTKISLTTGAENKNSKIRFCPLCVKEDRELYGETYWHRNWIIDEINVCAKHHCYLIDSIRDFSNMNSFKDSVAEICIPYNSPIVFTTNEKELQFSQYFMDVIYTNDRTSSVGVSDLFNAKLLETKYMSKSGKLKDMNSLYSDFSKFCQEFNIEIPVVETFRKLFHNKNNKTLYVCALGMFLGIEPYDLVNRSVSYEELTKDFEDKVNYLRKKNMSFKEIAKRLNTTERIVTSTYHAMDNKIDFDINSFLQSNLKKLYNGDYSNGRPQKVTSYIIEKYFDIPKQTLSKNQLYIKEIDKYNESYPEYWARELVWSYNQAKKNRNTVYLSHVICPIGIRREQFKMAVPFLCKYCDTQTEQEIIALVKS